jgi:hypothetical protein
MNPSLRDLSAFVPAILGAYILGAAAATHVNLGKLADLGLRITLRDRLQAMGHDLIGLSVTYLPPMVIALGVAFSVAAYLSRWMPGIRLGLYLFAGASGVVATHLIAEAVLGVNGLAAVRDAYGMALQALAGTFGAYIFYVATGWAHRSGPSPAAPRRA